MASDVLIPCEWNRSSQPSRGTADLRTGPSTIEKAWAHPLHDPLSQCHFPRPYAALPKAHETMATPARIAIVMNPFTNINTAEMNRPGKRIWRRVKRSRARRPGATVGSSSASGRWRRRRLSGMNFRTISHAMIVAFSLPVYSTAHNPSFPTGPSTGENR